MVAGKLYVTHSNGLKVWTGSAWDTNVVSPSTGNCCPFAVDSNDPLKIVVSLRNSGSQPMYRSSDGGHSWQEYKKTAPINRIVEVPWWPGTWFSSATSCMAFDPLNQGNLYYTDWYGIWHTPDAWASTTDWYTIERGHEEVVVLTLVSPPDGSKVYSGVCDVLGFSHTDVNAFPTKKLCNVSGFKEGTSISVCEQQPANIAMIGCDGNKGETTMLATSGDFGATWTKRTHFRSNSPVPLHRSWIDLEPNQR